MTKSSNPLPAELLALSVRYHEKTAAIYQTLIFLLKAEMVAKSVPELKSEIDKFEKYLKPHSLDYNGYFNGLLLFALVSELEIYLVDVVKALVRQYPKKIGDIQFKLSDLLDSTPDELITVAAEEYLNRLMYKKPSQYLSDLASLLAIDASPLSQHWPKFIEAKARRDLGIHNGWKINDIYSRKLTEVGLAFPSGKELLMLPDIQYLIDTMHACDAIVRILQKQLTTKYT